MPDFKIQVKKFVLLRINVDFIQFYGLKHQIV